MIVTPILDHGIKLGVSSGHRSKGLHMSDIYGALYKELEPKRFDRGEPMDLVRLEMGLAFENALEQALRDQFTESILRGEHDRGEAAERPGEFRTPEGIIFSPDLLVTNGILRVGEIKLTWLSSREVPRKKGDFFPPKFNKYFTQIMSYAHNLGTRFARLYIFHVNGAYDCAKRSGEPKPEFLPFDLEFTQQELNENWDMMLNFAVARKMCTRQGGEIDCWGDE